MALTRSATARLPRIGERPDERLARLGLNRKKLGWREECARVPEAIEVALWRRQRACG